MEFTFRHEQGKIKRLLAIHIPVMDLKASVTWYTDHFGLTLLQLNGSTAELAVLENGVTLHPTLILTKTKSKHRLIYEKNGRNRSMVMMHASNLEELRDRMVDAGANVTLPHADQEDDGCGRFFEATDPSGNIIQIQANDGKSPDDQLAIVKTGPFYKIRFGYFDVQEFGFFLFRHEGRTALHFKDTVGRVQECLVLQADDTAALHKHLTSKGHMVMETTSITDFGQMSFQIVDPDGNRIKVVPQEKIPSKESILTQFHSIKQ